MSFDDIDKMFAEAAGASEDTGEGDVGGDKKKAKVEKPEVETPKPKEQPKPKKEQKAKEPPKEKKAHEVEPEPKPKARKALVSDRNVRAFDTSQGITESSINKVLEMNDTYNKLNDTEKQFVSGYFQIEDEDNVPISKIIYGALTANKRDLDALTKVSEAREKDSAERAFYLMSLDGDNIEAIYEQVDLLTGNLGDTGKVTDENRINVCRTIEKEISEMPQDVFNYINKLQEFTNKALRG